MSPCGHFFRSRDPRPAGSGGAEGEHPLDVPCHGHEAPLATHLVEPAQQELAESEDRFDDAEHWFRDLFTRLDLARMFIGKRTGGRRNPVWRSIVRKLFIGTTFAAMENHRTDSIPNDSYPVKSDRLLD